MVALGCDDLATNERRDVSENDETGTALAEADPVAEPVGPSRALDRPAARALTRPPVIDLMDAQKLALVKSMIGPAVKPAGVGVFLEICAHYDLAWEAKEAWCVQDNDKLMVMVGRDGLRKVVTRNGLNMRGDTVRENDTFRVTWKPDRTCEIEHSIEGGIEQRGAIIGAWAEAWDIRSGEQRGYFYAAMSEYMPKSERKRNYSPWGSQASVMILAAAERQAARQATPLSGLMTAGEMDLNQERQQMLAGTGDAPEVDWPETEQGERIKALVARANQLEPMSWRPAKVALELEGKDPDGLDEFENRLREFVQAREVEVADAEVVVEVPWDPERYEQVCSQAADLDAELDEPDLDPQRRQQAEAELMLRGQEVEALERARDAAEAEHGGE